MHMAQNERRIRLDDRVIEMSNLDSLMLDLNKPIYEQEEAYRRGIDNLQAVLNEFRFIDGTVGMFQAPHYARIPILEFVKRGLVSEEGLSRFHLTRDEIWTSFDTKIVNSEPTDRIIMSYIARYHSYDAMKKEIMNSALPGQEQQIMAALPEADPRDNHITLEEIYELNGGRLIEATKQLTDFHFHVQSETRVGFLLDQKFEPIQLKTPTELSSRAFNRVLFGTFLPLLLDRNLRYNSS